MINNAVCVGIEELNKVNDLIMDLNLPEQMMNDIGGELHAAYDVFADREWFDYEPDEKPYGPSNPWDAPGMKISDFISGVY